MILPKEKYQKTVKRPYPPILASLILSAFTDEKVYESFFSRPYSRKDSLVCDGVWYNCGEAEDLGRQLIANEWNNKEVIEKAWTRFRELEKDLLKSVSKSFREFSKAYKNYMSALTLVFLAEQPFYDKIKEVLLSNCSKDETKRILEILNVPLEDNFYKKEELDLVQTKNIEEHVKSYIWFMSRNGADTPYTIEQAKKKLSEINKQKFLEDYYSSKKEIKETIIFAKKIVGEQYEYLVDGLQFIVFYRTHRTDILAKAAFLHIPVLKSIAKKEGLSYEDILFCLDTEVLENKIPSRSIIDERKRGYAIASADGNIVCFIGKEFEELRDKLEDKVEDVVEIKGNGASRGVATGKVKVIDNYKDFSKLKEGDVLVSSMTTPEMVPIMKIASAFVTDEGGVTCHAAIVAREMGKPCVIGTKIATKVLKDGDLVEVNADKGIVKRIK